MLKSIFSTIASAIRQGFAALGRVAAMPFRGLAAMLSGGAGGETPQIDIPEIAPPYVPEAAAPDRTEIYRALADAVMTWAAHSIIDDAPGEMPPNLQPLIKEWLQGLTRSECQTILEHDVQLVEAHIRGPFPIPGLRPVQYLTPLREWSPANVADAGLSDDYELSALPAPA